jgi:hypothetical protein
MPLYTATYDRKMLNRAIAAWCRTAAKEGALLDQLSNENSGLGRRDGKDYVVLRNELGHTLAVYRINNRGALKRLRRPPEELQITK